MARSAWVDASDEVPKDYVFPLFEIITAFCVGLTVGMLTYHCREASYLAAVKTNVEIRQANEAELRRAIGFCLTGH